MSAYAIAGIFLLILFLSSTLLSGASRWILYTLGQFDNPKRESFKKIQTRAIPHSVGIACILLACFSSYFLLNSPLGADFGTNPELVRGMGSVFLAFLVLFIGGYCDDRWKLHPLWQLLYVTVAILMIMSSGVVIDVGNTSLNYVVTFLWLLFCSAATKFLDGLDGLVTTIGFIGFFTIASVALFDRIQDTVLSIIALVWGVSLMGFLAQNFPSARGYLGEGPSIIIGLMIGYLSLLSSAKVVIGVSILGLFIVDVAVVWLLRILKGRNPMSGDRNHWHHRLLDRGYDKFQVLTLSTLTVLFVSHSAIWLSVHNQNNSVYLLGGIFLLLLLASFLLKKKSSKS